MSKAKKDVDLDEDLLTPQYSEGQGEVLRTGTHVGKDHFSNVPQMRNQGQVDGPTGRKPIPDAIGYAGQPTKKK